MAADAVSGHNAHRYNRLLKRRHGRTNDIEKALAAPTGKIVPSVSQKSRHSRQLVVGLALVILAFVWMVSSIYAVGRMSGGSTSVGIVSKGNAEVDAIVTLAMRGFRSTLMAHTLREVGLWQKPIFVLTDNPALEQEHLHETNVTLINVSKRLHPTFLSPSEESDYRHQYDTVQDDFAIKWQKTQIFQFLPPHIHTILFIDSDIITVRSLQSFMKDIAPNVQSEDCELSAYPERWYTNSPFSKYRESGDWNSGMMVLKRTLSHNLLSEWNRTIVTAPFSKRDQPKLTQVIQKLGTHVCPLPHRFRHVLYAADFVDRRSYQWGLRNPTFYHFASQKKVSDLWNPTIDLHA